MKQLYLFCKCNYLRALSASAAASLGLGIATQDVVVFLRNIGWEVGGNYPSSGDAKKIIRIVVFEKVSI